MERVGIEPDSCSYGGGGRNNPSVTAPCTGEVRAGGEPGGGRGRSFVLKNVSPSHGACGRRAATAPFRQGGHCVGFRPGAKHPEDVCPRGAVLWIQLCRVRWDKEPSPVPVPTNSPHPFWNTMQALADGGAIRGSLPTRGRRRPLSVASRHLSPTRGEASGVSPES